MVAGALNHGNGSGIAHREALAGNATEVALAANRAVQDRVSDDDRLLGNDAGLGGRPHHDTASGQPFAEIIIGVPVKLEGDAARQKGAEALSGSAGKLR